jgi:hypothetical protein
VIVTFAVGVISNSIATPLYIKLFNADSFLKSNKDVSLFKACRGEAGSLLNFTRRKKPLLLYSRRIMGSRLSLLVPSLLLLLPSLVLYQDDYRHHRAVLSKPPLIQHSFTATSASCRFTLPNPITLKYWRERIFAMCRPKCRHVFCSHLILLHCFIVCE